METENWVDLFHSAHLNKTLKKDGIVKIKLPLFNSEVYSTLIKSKIPGYPKDFESSFFQSVGISDLEVKQALHNEIDKLLTPTFDSLLINHHLLTYFFLVKGIGKNSLLKVHQDWSIIDERSHRAYNLWIPLCKSTKQNGTLYAAKGTHRMPLNVRGAGIPPKYSEHFNIAEKYFEAFELKEGEGLIFDCQLLHYSPPNTTDNSRTTIINNIIPNDASTMCFHGSKMNGGFIVNRYNAPEDLFIHYDKFTQQKDDPNPKGKFVETIDYANINSVTQEEFITLLKKSSTKKKYWFF